MIHPSTTCPRCGAPSGTLCVPCALEAVDNDIDGTIGRSDAPVLPTSGIDRVSTLHRRSEDAAPELVAERERLIAAHLAECPPRWRIFARRAWSRRLDALRAKDVSQGALLLRELYDLVLIEQFTATLHPTIAAVKNGKRNA